MSALSESTGIDTRVTIGDASFHISDTHIHILPQPLEKIPADIWRLTDMRRLMVNVTELTSFPAPPTPDLRVPTLVFFCVDGTKVKHIPPSVWKAFPGLETLMLSRNEMECSTLEGAFAHLPQLKMFDAWKNKLTKLPESLNQAQKLEILILSENEIGKLPDDDWWRLSMLLHLDLSHNKIQSVPPGMGERLDKLRWLDLGHNNLDALPSSIGKLTELRYLSIRGNGIKELPESMQQLIRLVVLDVADNYLDTVPAWFSKLFKLEALHMEENRITRLSSSGLGLLCTLKILNVSRNFLHTIADDLVLPRLQIFDASRNHSLREFPSQIGSWADIRRINMSHTAIREVPKEIGRVSGGLEVLDLHNTHIPQSGMGHIERLVWWGGPTNVIFRQDGGDPIVGAPPSRWAPIDTDESEEEEDDSEYMSD